MGDGYYVGRMLVYFFRVRACVRACVCVCVFVYVTFMTVVQVLRCVWLCVFVVMCS